MKKQETFQISLNQDQKEISVDLTSLQTRIFEEKGGNIYIGGEKVTDQVRSLLRDQARIFNASDLAQIIHATVLDESFSLYTQSGNMEHVQYVKALVYWDKVMRKLVNALAK